VPTRPSIDPTSQQDDDDDDDVRDVRDEVRHATTKKYFLFARYVSHQTSLRRLSRETSEDGTDGSTMERAFGVLLDRAERPERRRYARVRPTPHRVVSSFPRVGIISIDLIVDASASIARRRAPNAGTLSTDSLILPFFAFSLDAALSPPGRPTVKVRRTRTIGNASHTIRRKTAHRVRFLRARSRGRGRDSTGGIVDVHRLGGRAADPSLS
jgi:hypothetical protein